MLYTVTLTFPEELRMKILVPKKKSALTILVLIIGVAVFSFASNAHAVPMLRLTSGADTVTVTDNLGGDLFSGTPGAVLYFGTIGSFYFNLTAGITTPVFGSATNPFLDILSLNAGGGAGTLTFEFTETGFTSPTPVANFLASIGGTSSSPDTIVQLQTYLDISNTAFGLGTPLGNTGGISTGLDLAFSGASGSGDVATSNPYSLTMVVTLQHAGPAISSFDAQLNLGHAPEPGSMLLLGSGLVALGLYQRRRNNKIRS
jgi:hypothetical protein